MIRAVDSDLLKVSFLNKGPRLVVKDTRPVFLMFRPSPAIFDGEIPPGALLGDNGFPLQDDEGNILIKDD